MYRSRRSGGESRVTTKPRRGNNSTKPSLLRVMRASRTGVALIWSSSAIR